MPERSYARLSPEKKEEKKEGKIGTDKIDRRFAAKYAGEFSDNSFINRSRYGGYDIEPVCLACYRRGCLSGKVVYLGIRELRSARNRKTKSPDDIIRLPSRAIFLSLAG
jgi:hypothetical protein